VAVNIDTVRVPPANVAANAEPITVKKLSRCGTQHRASYLEYFLKITVVCDVTPCSLVQIVQICAGLRGVISRWMVFFIANAVRTSTVARKKFLIMGKVGSPIKDINTLLLNVIW
jgi:hypothetical protein